MQRSRHRADRGRQAGRDVGAGRGDDAGGEGRGVHAVLGGRRPVGVDRLHMSGIRLAAPAAHEPLGDMRGLVDLGLGNHRQTDSAGGLGDVGQHHHGGPREVLACLLVIDVVELPHPPRRGDHRDRALYVDPDVARMNRDRERFGRRQPRVVAAVDKQTPDAAERHPADELLDIDAAVAKRGAFLVGFGDLRVECDDTLEAFFDLHHVRVHCPARVRPAQCVCASVPKECITSNTSRRPIVERAPRQGRGARRPASLVEPLEQHPIVHPARSSLPELHRVRPDEETRTSAADAARHRCLRTDPRPCAYDASERLAAATTVDCGDAQAPSCAPRGRDGEVGVGLVVGRPLTPCPRSGPDARAGATGTAASTRVGAQLGALAGVRGWCRRRSLARRRS